MNDDEQSEKVLFSVRQKSIGDIKELLGKQIELQSLRIMHSPDLISMNGLENFKNLIYLNLSQNGIERMDGLQNCSQLEWLNLSGNRIKLIQGVVNLRKLTTLNISYNKIQLLQPIQIFRANEYHLQIIDLRCNMIQDLRELTYLQGIETLTEISFDSDKKPNPVCLNKSNYARTIISLQGCPNLKIIDKQSFDEFSKLATPQKKVNIIDEQLPNLRPSSPVKINAEWIEKETNYKADILQLKSKYEELLLNNKEITYKTECNEKYWSGKCLMLENEILITQQLNQNLTKDNETLKQNLSKTQQSEANERKEKIQTQERNEKKEIIIDQLQVRVNDLMMENGKLQKESSFKIEECVKLKQDVNDKQKECENLKRNIRELENQLQEFHERGVYQTAQSLQRLEDSQEKFEKQFNQNRIVQQENQKLKSRVQELIEICHEWEIKNKYDAIIVEQQEKSNQDLRQQAQEYENLMKVKTEEFDKHINLIEQESQRMQDKLEEEVRKVLKENMEKFKALKIQYEEKVKSESDLKQMLKVAITRNKDQETIIQELQEALIKFKRDVQTFSNEHVQIKQNLEEKNSNLQKELINLQLNHERQISLLTQLERENKLLKQELNDVTSENEKNKQKSKQYTQVEIQLEELQTTLIVKNKMLDDKNETIDDLKNQLENLKNSESNYSDDYNRLQRKFDRQNQIIEELENQQNQLQEDIDTKNHELKEKKHLISLFEKELEDIKEKQENEIQNLRAEIQDKDKNILELIKLLDDARDNLKIKENKVKERTQQIQLMECKLSDIDSQYEKHIQEKDKEINFLRNRLEEAQDELKALVIEVDRLKKAGRESLEKFQKLFNI